MPSEGQTEPASAASPESSPGYETANPVAPPPPPAGSQSSTAYALQPSAIRWELAWRGAVLCGIGAAILSAVPFVSLGCCLWMLGAGAVCVNLYRRQVPGTVVTPGMGMKLGAPSGGSVFVVNAIITTAAFVGRRSSGEFQQAMQEQMKKQLA